MNINSVNPHINRNTKQQPGFSGSRTVYRDVIGQRYAEFKPSEITGEKALSLAKRTLQQLTNLDEYVTNVAGRHEKAVGGRFEGKKSIGTIQIDLHSPYNKIHSGSLQIQRSLTNKKTGLKTRDTIIFNLNEQGKAADPKDTPAVERLLQGFTKLFNAKKKT